MCRQHNQAVEFAEFEKKKKKNSVAGIMGQLKIRNYVLSLRPHSHTHTHTVDVDRTHIKLHIIQLPKLRCSANNRFCHKNELRWCIDWSLNVRRAATATATAKTTTTPTSNIHRFQFNERHKVLQFIYVYFRLTTFRIQSSFQFRRTSTYFDVYFASVQRFVCICLYRNFT